MSVQVYTLLFPGSHVPLWVCIKSGATTWGWACLCLTLCLRVRECLCTSGNTQVGHCAFGHPCFHGCLSECVCKCLWLCTHMCVSVNDSGCLKSCECPWMRDYVRRCLFTCLSVVLCVTQESVVLWVSPPLRAALLGTSLVQWLRLQAPSAGGLGSIPGQGTRTQVVKQFTW